MPTFREVIVSRIKKVRANYIEVEICPRCHQQFIPDDEEDHYCRNCRTIDAAA